MVWLTIFQLHNGEICIQRNNTLNIEFWTFPGLAICSMISCFFDDPVDVSHLISGSSAFSKTSLNTWKFMVHVLLKPGLENFEHLAVQINQYGKQSLVNAKQFFVYTVGICLIVWHQRWCKVQESEYFACSVKSVLSVTGWHIDWPDLRRINKLFR